MKTLVVGSGGREHTLAWKLAEEPGAHRVYVAPGNGGIASPLHRVPVPVSDTPGLVDFARKEKVDLVVVGPEAPLVFGLVDELQRVGVPAFGPTANAARLEGSKAFAKEFMDRHDIPTASFRTFTSYDQAVEYVRAVGPPVVLKADGLAAGKGSIVAEDLDTAIGALHSMMVDRTFGDSGLEVVIEEMMEGEEASMMALVNGEQVVPLLPAQDHKRMGENDTGLNTGGMGSYAPTPFVTADVESFVVEHILHRTARGMAQEGSSYVGLLYAGIMITASGPKVVEFNCRFGDPECQAILPLLKDDLGELLVQCLEGKLGGVEPSWREGAAVCVVLASAGYPGAYRKGFPIHGLEKLDKMEDVVAFHAGTEIEDDGRQLVTSGGRVLGITAWAEDLPDAASKCYEAADQVSFEGVYYRRDIGARALRRVRG